MDWIKLVASDKLETVRLNFHRVYLTHILSTFSSREELSAIEAADDKKPQNNSSVVFHKASRLFHVSAREMILPMKFADDLDLQGFTSLSNHYHVSHKTKTDSVSYD